MMSSMKTIISSKTTTEPEKSFLNIHISNPKTYFDSHSVQESRLFPYYAGYSSTFASDILVSMNLEKDALILDPWNGSGTTTNAAYKLGYNAIGFDLNPVMVVVAKANTLSPCDAASLPHLARSLVAQALARLPYDCTNDSLCVWMTSQSAAFLRALEVEINHTLVSFRQYQPLKTNESIEKVSGLASFFYLALFRTCRRLLREFVPTNPTWTKKPESLQRRKRPSFKLITETFLDEVGVLSAKVFSLKRLNLEKESSISIKVGNAEAISLPDGCVDAVICSPPYCTRIDYAVATAIELAVLGFSFREFDELRRTLTGTSTVASGITMPETHWGNTCLTFLQAVRNHPSKASSTYYFKNHVQYFDSLARSISELGRVLTKTGICVLVIQDSRYKDLHNDVPTIVCEMAENSGLCLSRREDFQSKRSMAGLNGKAKRYLPQRTATESVLCFRCA